MSTLAAIYYVVAIGGILWIALMTTFIAGIKLYAYWQARQMATNIVGSMPLGDYLALKQQQGGRAGVPGASKSGLEERNHGQYM